MLSPEGQLSCLAFHVVWWENDNKRQHKWAFVSKDTTEDTYHAWAALAYLIRKLKNKVSQITSIS